MDLQAKHEYKRDNNSDNSVFGFRPQAFNLAFRDPQNISEKKM